MEDTYWLGNSDWAATRLRLQHELTQTNFDHKYLDPSIVVTEDAGPIADIATGTGVWALEMAEKHPNVQIECLDANLKELPPKSWLPSNVALRKFDLLQDVPDDMVGRYQIIHLQYVMAFVIDSNVDAVIARLVSMLKPGGYLQWTDTNLDRFSWRTAEGQEPVETHKLFQLTKDLLNARGESRMWLNDFEGLLKRAGLRNVKYSAPDSKPSTLQPVMMNWIWAIQEGFGFLGTKKDLPPEQKAAVDAVLDQREKVVSEVAKLRVGMSMGQQRCLGQKARQ